MNFMENMINSISGSVDKAIICVKKPVADKKTGFSVGGAASSIKLQADLASIKKNGMFSFHTQAETMAKKSGYHVLKVKYNPSKISFDSRAGSFIQQSSVVTNNLSQVIVPAQTYMSFEIIFDDENHQDAFMFDKFTNVSAGAVVSDVASVVKNVKDGGYSVKEEVEAMIGMLTQSETRQMIFYWSEMVFAGELVALDAQYTMFNTLGNPIRAVVKLTLRESEEALNGENNYWDNALDKLERKGSVLDKAANLINFR